MKSLRKLLNSYATPATEEELRLLDKLDGKTPPLSESPTRGGK